MDPAAAAKGASIKDSRFEEKDGAFHMGGTIETPGVDPAQEFYPAGQGVGAITELIPAGDIVRSMVAEAEEILAKPKTLVG